MSQGKLVTIENYYELFNGIIPPKQLEGLRPGDGLPAAATHNETEDRRTEHRAAAPPARLPFNAHTNKATISARRPSAESRHDRHPVAARHANSAAVRFAARTQKRSRRSPNSTQGRISTATM